MSANQHLPERSYPCRDCNRAFGTAEEFSNHFSRLEVDGQPTIIITGCSSPVPTRLMERPA